MWPKSKSVDWSSTLVVFCFVYFAQDSVYKVKPVFILFLIRSTKSLVFIKRYTNQFQFLPKYILTSSVACILCSWSLLVVSSRFWIETTRNDLFLSEKCELTKVVSIVNSCLCTYMYVGFSLLSVFIYELDKNDTFTMV